MGGLLDKPRKEKQTETGVGLGFKYAVSGMQGWRKSMEDTHITSINQISTLPNTAIFGVYDGHGGKEAAEFVAQELPAIFAKQAEAQSVGEAIRETYHELDRRMTKLNSGKYSMQGCTACTAVVHNSVCYFANAGDSRGIIGTKDGHVRKSTHDHKPNSPTEGLRIRQAGGTVDLMQGQFRVCQNLNLSRALGDLRYKQATTAPPQKQIISGSPDILEVALEAGDEWLIICCDGVWDVLSNEECLQFVRDFCGKDKSLPRIRACVEALLDRCCSRDATMNAVGTDNMTAIIVSVEGRAAPVFKLDLDVGCNWKNIEVFTSWDASRDGSVSDTTTRSGGIFRSGGSSVENISISQIGSGMSKEDIMGADIFDSSPDCVKLLLVIEGKKYYGLLPEPPSRIVYNKHSHQIVVY